MGQSFTAMRIANERPYSQAIYPISDNVLGYVGCIRDAQDSDSASGGLAALTREDYFAHYRHDALYFIANSDKSARLRLQGMRVLRPMLASWSIPSWKWFNDRSVDLYEQILSDATKAGIDYKQPGPTSPPNERALAMHGQPSPKYESSATRRKREAVARVFAAFDESAGHMLGADQVVDLYGSHGVQPSKIAHYLRQTYPAYDFLSPRDSSKLQIGQEIDSIDRLWCRVSKVR